MADAHDAASSIERELSCALRAFKKASADIPGHTSSVDILDSSLGGTRRIRAFGQAAFIKLLHDSRIREAKLALSCGTAPMLHPPFEEVDLGLVCSKFP